MTKLNFHRHPYYPAQYAACDERRVRVETPKGSWGYFTRDGVWLDGPLRHADPLYCRWITSELIAKNRLQQKGKI